MAVLEAKFVPDMMDASIKGAIMGALERLICDSTKLESIWPAASEALRQGSPILIGSIEIVVVPLDRIGAPAGASGAGVYIAYYAHADSEQRRLASPPLVVKVGDHQKLAQEYAGANAWPNLGPQAGEKFAFPFLLDDQDPSLSVLFAPFKSDFEIEQDGTRNRVVLRDLWKLLYDNTELAPGIDCDWQRIATLVARTLEAIALPHHGGFAKFRRKTLTYEDDYKWYLRGTREGGSKMHLPRLLFGTAESVSAFGTMWRNPVQVVDRLIADKSTFTGCYGSIHGDLHPKNIVLNSDDAVRIIDFGWAAAERHVVVDYLLLDANLRATTLPSQVSQADVLALARFLRPEQEVGELPEAVRSRGRIIKEEIWCRAREKVVDDWAAEYLTPLLLVAYGLLVHLDDARNQPAFVATVLALADEVGNSRP